jgi:hypothetical protein
MASTATDEQVDVRKSVARSETDDEVLQEEAVQLIGEGDGRDQQESGDPAGFSPSNEEKKPEEGCEPESIPMLVKVGDDGHDSVEQSVLKTVVAEVKQRAVNVPEEFHGEACLTGMHHQVWLSALLSVVDFLYR